MNIRLLSLLFCLSLGMALAQESVNVYSARHYDADVKLYDQFTAETGIKVNLIEGDADELIERIKSEGTNSPADLLITTDAGRLWRAEQAELLSPVTSEVLESSIPANLRDPAGLWFGLTQRLRVLIYNVNYVSPDDLSTYEDLASDTWKGRLCIRSSNNVYNQSLLASIITADGAEAAETWAQGLVDNFARPPQGADTDQITAVAAGECDVSIVNHYYYARIIADAGPEDEDDVIENTEAVKDNVGIFFPNQNDRGTHVNITGAGVLKNAPNRENAIKLLEYLVSPKAQAIFAEANFEYPVLADTSISEVITPLSDIKTDEVNIASYGENNPEAVRIMDRVGWR